MPANRKPRQSDEGPSRQLPPPRNFDNKYRSHPEKFRPKDCRTGCNTPQFLNFSGMEGEVTPSEVGGTYLVIVTRIMYKMEKLD